MKLATGLVLILCLSAIDAQQLFGHSEEVKLSYELVLNKCKEGSCKAESAARGEVSLSLQPEDPTFAWGYTAVEEFAGYIHYQLRFEAKWIREHSSTQRRLIVGFSGRNAREFVTGGEKNFSGKTWKSFQTMKINGDTYSKNEEEVTPTIIVKVVPS
jgi:hypothetical protein